MIKNRFNCNFAKFQKLIFFLFFIQTFLLLLNAVDEGFTLLLCIFMLHLKSFPTKKALILFFLPSFSLQKERREIVPLLLYFCSVGFRLSSLTLEVI